MADFLENPINKSSFLSPLISAVGKTSRPAKSTTGVPNTGAEVMAKPTFGGPNNSAKSNFCGAGLFK